MKPVRMPYRTIMAWLICGLGLCHTGVAADAVKVAVAANFTAAMKALSAGFEATTGHRILVSSGSSGKLYAQILHGAPFAVLLSADQARPQALVEQGRASARFTYAVGRLILWSRDPALVDERGKILRHGDFKHLAVANPKTAPYGVAARQVLDKLGIAAALESRLVRGDSVAQTYQFVATGNAELGFVALAQVALNPVGSRWAVPQDLYAPIRQDAVLLNGGTHQPAALALMAYLKSPAAKKVIESYGYGVE